ncbi:MAG: ATP-dependent helicase HrpB [Polyangiaceae bacterium]
MQSLPIDPFLPDVVRLLRAESALVVEAPPGAGKTTRIPSALLNAGLAGDGEVLVLEPRRLAARLAARRVAEDCGEPVGVTVGYQVRFEDVSGPRTKLRFVTEGVLTRRLLSSPDLRNVGVVVLDEFHERHLQGDVALAILDRLRRDGRPDLRLVVMSATLAAKPIADYLRAPILRAEGRSHTVTLHHLPTPDERPLSVQVASGVRQLLAGGLDGDILVFLPGATEIRKAREACANVAAAANWSIVPLHGDLSAQEQDAAVRPSNGRKLILSTNVAESSVTIEGIVAVVDSGLARVASQAPWSGFPRLRVEKISRSSATQRAGRAGRTRAGICMRLYTAADFDSRSEHDVPEIRRLDLSQTWLELTGLGKTDLRWLEPPSESHTAAAIALLQRLGAVDAGGAITDVGRSMLRLAVHPRAARVVVEGARRGFPGEASVAAAILSEGDPRSQSRARFGGRRVHDQVTEDSDLGAILDLFREAEEAGFSPGSLRAAELDPGATRAIAQAATQLRRACAGQFGARDPDESRALGIALLAGYPDRVAKRVRAGGRQVALSGGGSAELDETSAVRDAEWLLALDVEERAKAGERGPARSAVTIRLAHAIDPSWLMDLYPDQIVETREVKWDAQKERVTTTESLTWHGLPLLVSDQTDTPSEEASRVLADAALAAGPNAFAPPGAVAAWLARAQLAASLDPAIGRPDDATVAMLLVELSRGRRSFADLRQSDLLAALRATAGPRLAGIERLAPERVLLASGRSVPVRYDPAKPPAVASRIQDFFGMSEGPRIGNGRVPLVLELLAPNGRAAQVTSDLAGFWARHYPAIRRELMRRYPRHSWPEDPTKAGPAIRAGR